MDKADSEAGFWTQNLTHATKTNLELLPYIYSGFIDRLIKKKHNISLKIKTVFYLETRPWQRGRQRVTKQNGVHSKVHVFDLSGEI